MNCSRATLVFSDYSWTGIPEAEAALFNRRDGNQMLTLLNKWAVNWPFRQTTSFFNNLERVIRQLVPARFNTPADVRGWVESHTPVL